MPVSAPASPKLAAKDLVLVGVLGAVAGAVCMVISLLCGMSPVTNPLYAIIAAIPVGIVYMLMLAKVPKHGVFTVAGIVYGALFLAMGCFWFVVLCFVAASVVADAVMWPNPRSVTRMSVAYAVSVTGLSFGYNGAIVLMHDIYETSVDAAVEMMDRLIAEGYTFVTVPDLLAARNEVVLAGVTYTNGAIK